MGHAHKVIGAVENSLGQQESGRQLPIVAGGTHSDGNRPILNPDLQRFFHDQGVECDLVGGSAADANLARDLDESPLGNVGNRLAGGLP